MTGLAWVAALAFGCLGVYAFEKAAAAERRAQRSKDAAFKDRQDRDMATSLLNALCMSVGRFININEPPPSLALDALDGLDTILGRLREQTEEADSSAGTVLSVAIDMIDQSDERIAASRKTMDDLGRRILSVEGRLAMATLGWERAEAEVKRLQSHQRIAVFAELRDKVTTLEQTNERLATRRDELLTRCESLDEQLTAAKNDAAHLGACNRVATGYLTRRGWTVTHEDGKFGLAHSGLESGVVAFPDMPAALAAMCDAALSEVVRLKEEREAIRKRSAPCVVCAEPVCAVETCGRQYSAEPPCPNGACHGARLIDRRAGAWVCSAACGLVHENGQEAEGGEEARPTLTEEMNGLPAGAVPCRQCRRPVCPDVKCQHTHAPSCPRGACGSATLNTETDEYEFCSDDCRNNYRATAK